MITWSTQDHRCERKWLCHCTVASLSYKRLVWRSSWSFNGQISCVCGLQCGYRRCKSKVLCHVESTRMQGLKTCCGSSGAIGMFKNKNIKSPGVHILRDTRISLQYSGEIINKYWMEMALKISLHSWKFYLCGGKIEEQNVVAKPQGVWRGVPLPFAASFALQFCWSIRKPTRHPCCSRLKVRCFGSRVAKKYLWRLALKASLFIYYNTRWPKVKVS